MGELLIERIPIEDYERVLPQKSFPRMPILYLELLENKTKVRKDLLNKLHKPPPPKPEPEPEPTRDTSFEQFQSSHAEEQVVDSSGAGDGEGDEDSGEKIIEDQLNTLLGEDKSQAASAPEPPTLQELQQKKKVTINNSYNYVEEDEETQKERNTVYFKYEVLRRMHPNASIPEFTLYSDPKLMSQKYEMLTKKLSLDSSVENWKRYMIVFVMGCEVALGKVNFDMEGFAQQQIMSMKTYDQLLVEMAEKSYMPSGSKWSPEIRLFMMLTMNVVLFVVSKMIFKKTGTNLLGTINSMTNTAERSMKEPTMSAGASTEM
ncbi:putative orf56L protein [carnivorous sponge associated iridovirus]|jgi:hypothetical protein|nr:putative orf56L protein [carnivorous sponge associated iridovirus]